MQSHRRNEIDQLFIFLIETTYLVRSIPKFLFASALLVLALANDYNEPDDL